MHQLHHQIAELIRKLAAQNGLLLGTSQGVDLGSRTELFQCL